MQSYGALIAVVAVTLGLLSRKKSKQIEHKARQVRGPAPAWTQPWHHLVPEWLRHQLSWYDWAALRDINTLKLQTFCPQSELDSFAEPVVLCMTTSPERLQFCGFILSLIDLTYVTRIEINLPRKFGRSSKEYGPIPSDLARNDKVFICWQEEDWGPIMKVLPSADRAQKEGSPNAVLISIDDDMCYPRQLVKMLLSAQIAVGGNAVICSMGAPIDVFIKGAQRVRATEAFRALGVDANRTCQQAPRVEHLHVRELVEGFGGIAYRAKHIDVQDALRMSRLSLRCFQSDDLVMSAMLQKRGVCRMKPSLYKVHGFSFGNEEDALHLMQDHNAQYSECIDSIALAGPSMK